MFTFTSKIFFILLDAIVSAALIGVALIIMALILYTVITAIKAFAKSDKKPDDK